MTRDPRTEPRPGDVVKRRTSRTVDSIYPRRGLYYIQRGGKLSGCRHWATFTQWQQWAATATIIQRGPDE